MGKKPRLLEKKCAECDLTILWWSDCAEVDDVCNPCQMLEWAKSREEIAGAATAIDGRNAFMVRTARGVANG